MRTQHPLSRRITGLLAVVTGLALLLAAPAHAQPTPAAAIDAFTDLADYLRAGEAGAPAPIDLPETDAVGVLVSLDGVLVARGFAAASTASERSQTAIAAVRAAMPDARAALGRSRADASELMLSIEFAGPPRSLLGDALATPSADWVLGSPGPAIRPGVEGLLVRLASPAGIGAAVRTPAWMVRSGLGPTAAAHAAAADLSGDPGLAGLSVAELADRGFSFAAFSTVHLAQIEPRGAPVFLHRGGRFVDLTLVSVGDLPKLGARIAGHLRTRAWPGVEPFGMLGDLDAVRGRYDPPIAGPSEQALAAFAAFTWARAPGVDAAERTASRDFAQGVLEALAERDDSEPDPTASPIDAAAVLVAATTVGADRSSPAVGDLVARALESVRPSFADAGAASGVPVGARGLIALAAVRAHELGDQTLAEAAGSVAAAYAAVPPERVVALMPFVGFASIELAAAEGAPVRAAVVLRESRALTDRFRINAEDVDPEGRDLVGGIVFTVGSTPLPTWQTLRPVAFEAAMLRYPELTPGSPREGELQRRIVQHANAMRFISQLAARREEAHGYARPGFAVGGVRTAVWSSLMPVEASSLGLLAVAETLTSLDAIQARGRGSDAAGRDAESP